MDRKRDCRKYFIYYSYLFIFRYFVYRDWKIEYTSPLDFFELYFTKEAIGLLVTETNRFASQFFVQNADKIDASYSGQWTDVNITEMNKLIALIFLMGVVYKPSVPLYWSTDELFHTPIFQKAHNRFQLMLKFLHFNDNANPTFDISHDGHHWLHKVRLLIELLCDHCKRVYSQTCLNDHLFKATTCP